MKVIGSCMERLNGVWIGWMILLLLAIPGVSPAAGDLNYRVGEGDVLKVNIHDNPDLSSEVRVSGNGTINLPLAGRVQVGGLSVDQVADRIADKYSEGYLVNPQVSVFIEQFRSKKVTILGQVGKPGLYEMSGPTTLLELISEAGGLAEDYGDKVTIHRRVEGSEEETISVSLKSLLEDAAELQPLSLMHGDSVVVSKARMIFVSGEVRKPDAYKYEQGTTVLKAITRAGGFTDIAAPKKIKIYRELDGRKHVAEKVPMDTPVQPDDVIVVPESFF